MTLALSAYPRLFSDNRCLIAFYENKIISNTVFAREKKKDTPTCFSMHLQQRRFIYKSTRLEYEIRGYSPDQPRGSHRVNGYELEISYFFYKNEKSNGIAF